MPFANVAHSITVTGLLLLAGNGRAETWLALSEQGNLLREKGQCREAIPVLSRAKSVAVRELGVKHSSGAIPTNNLAVAYLCLGELKRAEGLFREALVLLDGGPSDPMKPGILNNLGVLLIRLSRDKEAEQILMQALSLSEALLGPSHRTTGGVVTGLGVISLETGDYTRARVMFRRALAIWEASGSVNLDTATALNNLAVTHLYIGEYGQARDLAARALELRRQLTPPGHPDIAQSLYNYAVAVEKLGQRQEARVAFREAAGIRKAHANENVLGATVDVRLLKGR